MRKRLIWRIAPPHLAAEHTSLPSEGESGLLRVLDNWITWDRAANIAILQQHILLGGCKGDRLDRKVL
jgi:hypothetical protein